MSQGLHLSIDTMGGDHSPRLCVDATLTFLKRNPDVSVTLVGERSWIEPAIQDSPFSHRINLVHTDSVVRMNDRPGEALRQKQDSSMWMALQLLAEGKADACISCGNTGALMAMGRHLIKTFSGMSRPAICKSMPTAKGASFFLDLGANLNCSSQQLVQFAVMGSALARVQGKEKPRVALLNVGTETTKGNEDIKATASLLRGHPDIDFHGFIEGNHLFSGDVDVVVCDGFVGNVALKVSEGVANFAFAALKDRISNSLWKRLAVQLLKPALRSWGDQFNPSRYNGAALLGLRKIVIKSHGKTDALGFQRALETAKEQVEAKITDKIEQCLARH